MAACAVLWRKAHGRSLSAAINKQSTTQRGALARWRKGDTARRWDLKEVSQAGQIRPSTRHGIVARAVHFNVSPSEDPQDFLELHTNLAHDLLRLREIVAGLIALQAVPSTTDREALLI